MEWQQRKWSRYEAGIERHSVVQSKSWLERGSNGEAADASGQSSLSRNVSKPQRRGTRSGSEACRCKKRDADTLLLLAKMRSMLMRDNKVGGEEKEARSWIGGQEAGKRVATWRKTAVNFHVCVSRDDDGRWVGPCTHPLTQPISLPYQPHVLAWLYHNVTTQLHLFFICSLYKCSYTVRLFDFSTQV